MNLRIAVLGPRGTNAEEAVIERWGRNVELLYGTIPEVFDYVDKRKAVYGVVPIEDSVEGDVPLTYDLLRSYDLFVVEELLLPVTHYLLVKEKRENIKSIASHPQALAHCRRYLQENFPNAKLITTSSTAEAARLASIDPTIGAIANKRAAKIYNLKVVDREVHDHGSNVTRFPVLSKKPKEPKGPAHTFIIVDLPKDKPGSLCEILTKFAIQGINLTKIVSRSARGILGEYIFFINFKGDQNNYKVKKALEAISQISAVKILGSYVQYKIKKRKTVVKSQITTEDLRLMEPSLSFWKSSSLGAY